MKTVATLALGACMTVAFAGAGFAASASSMTSSEKTTWTKCQGMTDSAMQQDAQCQALLKKYPDAKSTTGSGMSGSSSGTSSTMPKSK
jgi:hypothetical protein